MGEGCTYLYLACRTNNIHTKYYGIEVASNAHIYFPNNLAYNTKLIVILYLASFRQKTETKEKKSSLPYTDSYF